MSEYMALLLLIICVWGLWWMIGFSLMIDAKTGIEDLTFTGKIVAFPVILHKEITSNYLIQDQRQKP